MLVQQSQQSGPQATNVLGGTNGQLNVAVTLPILGQEYASAVLRVLNAPATPPTYVIESSNDGGQNYYPAPYPRQIDIVAANQATKDPTAAQFTTLSAWEVVIPANTTHLRARCSVLGTNAQMLQLAPLQAFTPACPVFAALYDITSGVGVGLTTPTYDLSGWGAMNLFYSSGGATAGGVNELVTFDDGTTFTAALLTAVTQGFVVMSHLPLASTTIPALPRRAQFSAPLVAAQAVRLTLQVMR
jgi:hypothetical protein